ncbi:MAG: ActS/PrrB/RegB family redox-sensitive histidine kinase [Hyphomicrobiales bacterium]|nr:ActS/PrrB/RegB family redox-sensitive histidine kinase [Hyphomicrobiales bacterium]
MIDSRSKSLMSDGGSAMDKLDIDGSRLRLQTIIRLRWVAVAGQTITVLIVYFGFNFQFPLAACLMVIALSACLNVGLQLAFPASKRLLSRYAMLMLGYDILQLALLLCLTGGLQNPFALLMVVPVAVSAATQPLGITSLLAGFAVVCASLLTRFYWPLPWMSLEPLQLPFLYLIGNWAALVSCIVFIALYVWRTGQETRVMSEALAATELILAREQKLSELDGMAAAAAHKLGTPLSTIVVIAREMERVIPEDSPLREDAQLLRSQAMRCREILSALTRYTGEADEVFSTMRLTHLLEDVADQYRGAGVQVTVKSTVLPKRGSAVSKEPVMRRNPGVIYGLGNLVENAVDFARAKVDIEAQWDDDVVSVTITDDGDGFPPNIMSHLGEPYVTTRGMSQIDDGEEHGMGLGFFIAKTLLERSGASIQLGNRTAVGTGAVINLRWQRDKLQAGMMHST